MAEVIVEGVFMGASLKTTEYEGVKKTKLHVDVYQPKSEKSNKTVTLSTDDVSQYQTVQENYTMGTIVKVLASVNAYKNQAYFKLLNFSE